VEADRWRRPSGARAGGGVGHQSRRQTSRWRRPVQLVERHRWRRRRGAGADVESGTGANGRQAPESGGGGLRRAGRRWVATCECGGWATAGGRWRRWVGGGRRQQRGLDSSRRRQHRRLSQSGRGSDSGSYTHLGIQLTYDGLDPAIVNYLLFTLFRIQPS
jgi:hypothetical protein